MQKAPTYVLGCKEIQRHILPNSTKSILDFYNNARAEVQAIDALSGQEVTMSRGIQAPWLYVDCSFTNLLSEASWRSILRQIQHHQHVGLYTINPCRPSDKFYNLLSIYMVRYIDVSYPTFVKFVPAPLQTTALVQAGLHQFAPVQSEYFPMYDILEV